MVANKTKRARFLRFQFGIRTLAFVCLMIAFAFGGLSWKIRDAKVRWDRVNELRAEGWQLAYDSDSLWINSKIPEPSWSPKWIWKHLFSSVTSIQSGGDDSLTSLDLLSQFPDLTLLEIGFAKNFHDLSGLSQVPKLEYLTLRSCPKISNIDAIRGLRNLESLNLESIGLEGLAPGALDGLEKLKDLKTNCFCSKWNLEALSTLTNLESVDIQVSEEITNIDGLRSSHNLRKLNLYQSSALENLDGLIGLTKLEELDLTNCNALKNIDGLADTTGVKKLYLRSDQLESIDGLKNMSSLEQLHLSCSQITDLDALQALTKLKEIWIDCPLENLRGLKNTSLVTQFEIHSDVLVSLEGIEGMTQLDDLDVSKCSSLTDISALRSLTQLRTLDLRKASALTDLRPLEGLVLLEELELQDCDRVEVKDLKPLANLESLLRLDIDCLVDLKPIESLEQLEYLNLGHSQNLQSLDGIQNLTRLTELSLWACDNLTEFQPVETCLSLEKLQLSYISKITSLSPIRKLRGLKSFHLDLCEHAIDDMQAICALPELKELEIGSCSALKEVNFLNSNSIKSLRLRHCGGITDYSGINGLPNLEKIDISGEFESLEFISKLSKVKHLTLEYSDQLRSTSGIENMPALEFISMNGNPQLAEIDLRPLKCLTQFSAYGCGNAGEMKLEGLSKLQVFSIGFDQLEKVSGLANMPDLREVNVSGARVTEIGPLLNLGSLSRIDVRDCNLKSLVVNNCDSFHGDVLGMEELETMVFINCDFEDGLRRYPREGKLKRILFRNCSEIPAERLDCYRAQQPNVEIVVEP